MKSLNWGVYVDNFPLNREMLFAEEAERLAARCRKAGMRNVRVVHDSDKPTWGAVQPLPGSKRADELTAARLAAGLEPYADTTYRHLNLWSDE